MCHDRTKPTLGEFTVYKHHIGVSALDLDVKHYRREFEGGFHKSNNFHGIVSFVEQVFLMFDKSVLFWISP